MRRRTLALAGVLQAVRQVHLVATTGNPDGPAFEVSIDSVFKVDSASVLDCYGGRVAGLQLGLTTLAEELDNRIRMPEVFRYAFALFHLEKKLRRRTEMTETLGAGIDAVRRQADHLGHTHETVLARLADLYVDTISQLSPRILVQGNPLYLQQDRCVAQIRALLLAGMRSAVLFSQVGGSRWQLLLRRRQFLRESRSLLADLEDGANAAPDLR
ncbi:MAG: high frequency lysogenization protein HflD [Xanthomonadales bacterium]|nr:high frequency lysogenization protein HflD [Xanthomonadales bacterium]